MSFRDMKGQDRAVSFLRGALAGGRVSHAYIFYGPEGVGKRTAALDFAKALQCLEVAGARPCGECLACKRISSSNHPDVSLIKPPRGEAFLGIDEIRGIIGSVGFKPYEARWKVYIIDDVDSMTNPAQNALLKTLEEPPPQVVLILIAKTLESLLPTIVSRSQHVKFFLLRPEAVEDILISACRVDAVHARLLGRVSSGSIGRAVSYIDTDFLETRRAVIEGVKRKKFFDLDLDGPSRTVLNLYLDIMLTWYRDILAVKSGLLDPEKLLNFDEADAIADEAKTAEFDFLDDIIKQIISTRALLDQNVNPKLAMGVLGLSLS